MDTIFFLASKLIWGLIRPESWLFLGLIAALVAHWRARHVAVRRWLVVGIVAIGGLGTFPVGDWLIAPLEPPVPRAQKESIAGIIVLGGAEDMTPSNLRGTPNLNAAGERLLAAGHLARLYPEVPIIYTGGSGRLRPTGLRAADVAAQVFDHLGVDPARITFENQARTTWENAQHTAALLPHASGQNWVLVTSAFHMPRARGAFCAAGWGVRPWPTDYRGSAFKAQLGWDLAHHLETLNVGLKEWVGLFAYRATGRWKDPATCID